MDIPNQKNQNSQTQVKPAPSTNKPVQQVTSKVAPAKNTSATTPASSPVMQVTAAFVVGILVGVIGYTLATRHPSLGTSSSDTDTSLAAAGATTDTTSNITPAITTTDAASATATASDNNVIVRDQAAGTSISVAQVDLKDGGWIAIHEDISGKPGPILGAAYFAAGQTLNGAVPLLRPTIAGNSYLAVVHFDTGKTPRTFNYRTDVTMDDSTGQPIATPFAAQ